MKASDVKEIKSLTLLLDKERHFIFDLNALAALEDVADIVETKDDDGKVIDSYPDVFDVIISLIHGSPKAIKKILWAGLVHEDESLTLKQVGSLISMANLKEITEKIKEATTAALPDAEPSNGKKSPNVEKVNL